mgnify:CR=1 FL=1
MAFATGFRVGLSSEKALGVVDALSEAKTDDAHSFDSTHSSGPLADNLAGNLADNKGQFMLVSPLSRYLIRWSH